MKKLRFIAAAALLLGSACQRENSFPEVTNMPVEENGEEKIAQPAGKLVGQMIFDSVAYAVQPEDWRRAGDLLRARGGERANAAMRTGSRREEIRR